MAKRALVRCDGFITDIVEAGEEFEIYTGPGSSMKWVDIPDDATIDWKLELGEWIPDFEHHDPEMLRMVAYGDPGEQLSMIYRDIKNGTLNQDGEFFKHVDNVKTTMPKVQYAEVEVTDEMTGETRIETVKVMPDEPFPHGEEIPAWMSVSDLDDDTQREFGLGKYAPEAQQPAPDA